MNVDWWEGLALLAWLKLAEIIPAAILTRMGGNWWEGLALLAGAGWL